MRSVGLSWLMGIAVAVAIVARSPIAPAAERADPGEIRGLKLGQNANEMTVQGFGEFACGSNGGPRRQLLSEWSEFLKCRPESSGLYEVAVRFDDRAEYIGKAIDDPAYTRSHGTRVAGHPVILSVLFDSGGSVRGIRFVTDPRDDPAARRMAHLLRLAVMDRYGSLGWTCQDFEPAEGETPVGGVFVKTKCLKRDILRALTVEAHFLRKPGQSDTDPVTKEYRPGQFESWTRVEILDPSFAAP